MCRFILIRPGATEFDEQGRMKGCLDIPLSPTGREQVERTVTELANLKIDAIISAPCESAVETANRLAAGRNVKVRVVDCLRNVDHGLWHGKLIEEVRRTQPKVYKQGQDCPLHLCPPGGESILQAQERVLKEINRLAKRITTGNVALVIPEPLATIVHAMLEGEELRDLWKAETDAGKWELIGAAT